MQNQRYINTVCALQFFLDNLDYTILYFKA